MSDFLTNQDVICRLLEDGGQNPRICSLLIGKCGTCHRDLQWPVPHANAWASAVSCPECGRYYFTEGRSSHPPTLKPEFAPSESEGETCEWLTQLRTMDLAPASSDSIVGQIVGANRQTCERREHIRFDVDNVIVGIPLDLQARPVGMARDITLMDLSESGMQLFTLGSWHAPLVAVDFTKLGRPGTQLIASVVWQTSHRALTRLGCRFLLGPNGQLPLE